MNDALREALLLCETDVDGAIRRFYGNEELYLSLINAFTKETTMDQLNEAIDARDWDAAFMSAHALKGLAGNLGFVPLFHSLGELILYIRARKLGEITSRYLIVKNCYRNIMSAIIGFK